jgi:lipopolysaccharide transport system permease protein
MIFSSTSLFTNIWNFRQLLFFLTLRDIKVRYKQAFLGIAWAILTPAVHALILTLIFDVFLKAVNTSLPYLLMVYSGLIFWNFLSQSIASSTNSLIDNYNLVTKSACPKEIIVIASVMGRIPDFLISIIFILLMMIYFKIYFSIMIFILIPLFIIETIFVIGIGLIVACTNVYFRDIAALIPILLTLWFYLTPIIYPINSLQPKYHFLLILNPMTGIINNFRIALTPHSSFDTISILFSFVISVSFLHFGYMVFKKLEKDMVDVI